MLKAVVTWKFDLQNLPFGYMYSSISMDTNVWVFFLKKSGGIKMAPIKPPSFL